MDQGILALDTPYTISYQTLRYLGIGSKNETRNNERSMAQRVERRQPVRTAKSLQENVHTHPNCIRPIFSR